MFTIGSTEGADENFPVLDVFKEFLRSRLEDLARFHLNLYRFANDFISFECAGEGLLGAVSGNAGQLYSGAFDKFNSPEYFLSLTTPADFPSAVFGITGNASSEIVGDADWAGIVLTDNDTTVGMIVQRSWFLRDGESGLHSFLRLGYHNATGPSLGRLGESRTMFRPNGGPWTHIVTNSEHANLLLRSLISAQFTPIARRPSSRFNVDAVIPHPFARTLAYLKLCATFAYHHLATSQLALRLVRFKPAAIALFFRSTPCRLVNPPTTFEGPVAGAARAYKWCIMAD
ncbi:hypothetical protein B0H13DRAFT_2344131 [Mycena leptocephala]|nr:hypothetical protein B0H13DRAFT_2344131 [Mycena leptocephala]